MRLLSKVAEKGNTAKSFIVRYLCDIVVYTSHYFMKVDIISKFEFWRAVIVELWGLRGPHPEWISNSYISFEQSYIFRKLHHQEGMSYIWLVKWNLQAPPV